MEEEANELNLINEWDFIRLKDQWLVEMQKAAAIDVQQKMLSNVIQQGWPDQIQQVPEMVKKYWTFRELLVVQDGIIYKRKQVVVLAALLTDYLRHLHSSHMGSESTIRRAREARQRTKNGLPDSAQFVRKMALHNRANCWLMIYQHFHG